MYKTALGAAMAALVLLSTPASAAKINIEAEIHICKLDEFAGRLAAWYFRTEFEGGALCGQHRPSV